MPQQPDFSELFLDAQFCFALYETANRFNRVYGTAIARFGLTLPQLLVLMALWERSPRAVGDIAGALDLDSGTITPLLKRVEAGGFVRRVRDEADERRVFVHVTEKALALRQPIMDLKEELACTLDLTEEEIITLRDGLVSFSKKLARLQ